MTEMHQNDDLKIALRGSQKECGSEERVVSFSTEDDDESWTDLGWNHRDLIIHIE